MLKGEYDINKFSTESVFLRLQEKAEKESQSFDVALGNYEILNDGKLLPLATGTGLQAFNRIKNLVNNYGPKILKSKLNGIGNYSINTTNQRARDILALYDLPKMIREAATDLIVKGITAVAIGTKNNETKLFPLKGFVVNLPDLNDMSETVGILQAWTETGKWEIRLYREEGVYKWHRKKHLTNFLNGHDEFEESQIYPLAFSVVAQADEEGISVGEVEQALPALLGVMAQIARLHRVQESALPRLKIKGQLNDTSNLRHVPDNALSVDKEGDVSYVEAPNLDGYIKTLEKLEETLLTSISVPEGLFGNKVSGRSIELANAEYNASVETYANLLSDLFTKAFRQLFIANGFNADDFTITVKSKPVTDTQAELNDALTLFDAGIFEAVDLMDVVSKRFPTLSPERVAALVERLTNQGSQNNNAQNILNNLGV